MRKKFSIILFFLLPLCSNAQKDKDSLDIQNLRNSVFVEIGGASGHFSLNYDRQLNSQKRLLLVGGIGLGYKNSQVFHNADFEEFVDNLEYTNLSYTLRFDVVYNRKNFEPVLGYSFTQGVDIDFFDNYFLVNSLSCGLKINLSKRVTVLPKYYFMINKETNYSGLYVLHWSGLQIKYNF